MVAESTAGADLTSFRLWLGSLWLTQWKQGLQPQVATVIASSAEVWGSRGR